MTYTLDDFVHDFPALSGKCYDDNDKNMVIVYTDHRIWDDYCKDKDGNFVLKSDAIPCGYRIGTNKFKSLEEMFIFIDLNYGYDVTIYVDDCLHSNDIVNAWCNYNRRIAQQ